MKKLLLSLSALLLMLGCSSKDMVTNKLQTMTFVGIDDPSYKIELSSDDEFETAYLRDNKGHRYVLKEAKSASGMRLANEKQGVEIMFKKGEGIVNFGAKDIFIEEK